MAINKDFSPEKEAAALFLLDQAMGFTYQAALRAVTILGGLISLQMGQKQHRNWRRNLVLMRKICIG